jgi:hypothetical protein
MVGSRKNLAENESGFASIVIALVLILVLSLLTVSFAKLARREQQNALNKSLSLQAYYAAESGINDIYNKIKSNTITDTTSNVNTNTCLDPSLLENGGVVNGSTDVSYSCALVHLKLPALVFGSVGADTDHSITFTPDTDLGQGLAVSWGSTTSKSLAPANAGFLPATGGASNWNYPAVLQVSIVPLSSVDRTSLTTKMYTAYLYPSSGGGSTVYAVPEGQVPVVAGNCSGSGDYPCSVKFMGLAQQPYLIHIHTFYDESNISIGGKSSIGSTVNFTDGQALIDVTGKAKNVLKRIQVHVPYHQTATVPPAIEGQNICKQFSTYPGYAEPSNASTDVNNCP